LVSSTNDVHVGAKQGDTSPPAPFGFVLALPCACALRAQIPGIVDAQFTIFALVSRADVAIHPSSARGTDLAIGIELGGKTHASLARGFATRIVAMPQSVVTTAVIFISSLLFCVQ